MVKGWDVSDGDWELIGPVLRPQRREDGRGRPWQDTRGVLNGVLWVLGSGSRWCEMPERYPPYQTCHRRFQRWVREGRLRKVLRRLAARMRERGDLDLAESFIDATFSNAKKGALRSARLAAVRAPRSC